MERAQDAPVGMRANGFGKMAYFAVYVGTHAQARELHTEALRLMRQTGDTFAIAWLLVTSKNLEELEEGLRLFEEMGDRQGTVFGHFAVARKLCGLSEFNATRTHLEQAVAIDENGPHALYMLGRVALLQGDFEAARVYQQRSLALRERPGTNGSHGERIYSRGGCTGKGDFASARPVYEKSLRYFRETGEPWAMNYALRGLSEMALLEGDVATRAPTATKRSLAPIDPEKAAPEIYQIRGKIALAEGQHVQSRGFLWQALTFQPGAHDKRTGAATLEGMAALEQAEGQGERAARLLGAAAALREALGHAASPHRHAGHEALWRHFRRHWARTPSLPPSRRARPDLGRGDRLRTGRTRQPEHCSAGKRTKGSGPAPSFSLSRKKILRFFAAAPGFRSSLGLGCYCRRGKGDRLKRFAADVPAKQKGDTSMTTRRSLLGGLAATLALGFLALLAPSAAWAQSSYTIQLIPAYNGTMSQPRAINNNLLVAGNADKQPFVWKVGDPAVTPLPIGLGAATPADINNSGQIVGGAFLWTLTASGYVQSRIADLPIAGTGRDAGWLGMDERRWVRHQQWRGPRLPGRIRRTGRERLRSLQRLPAAPDRTGEYSLTPIATGYLIQTLSEDTRTFDPATGAQTGGHGPQFVAKLLNSDTGVQQSALCEWDESGGRVKRWLDAPFNQGRGLNDREEVVDWGSRGTINLPALRTDCPPGTVPWARWAATLPGPMASTTWGKRWVVRATKAAPAGHFCGWTARSWT
jgi:tetratricopeptide (TPR) repeat protein